MTDNEPAGGVQVESVVVRAGETGPGDERQKREGSAERTAGSEPAAKRPRSATVRDAELGRQKRLFGGLLGQLGKFERESKGEQAQQRALRRAEVERRLQEKLARERVVSEPALPDEEALQAWETEAARLRTQNAQCRARFLQTSGDGGPAVYYMPWKLLPSQEDELDANARRMVDEDDAGRMER